jgi:hypothetical protein
MNIRIAMVILAALVWGIPAGAEDQFLVECRIYEALETDEAYVVSAEVVDETAIGFVEGRIDGDDPEANGFYKDGDHLVRRDTDSGIDHRYELVSSPNLMVLADEEASIQIGSEIPYIDAESGDDEVQHQEVGITVKVIVHHSSENLASLTSNLTIVEQLTDDPELKRPVFAKRTWDSENNLQYGVWMFQRTAAADGEEHMSFLRVTRNPERQGD